MNVVYSVLFQLSVEELHRLWQDSFLREPEYEFDDPAVLLFRRQLLFALERVIRRSHEPDL